MRDPHDLTVRLQALDGRWETVGQDRYRGILVEHFAADSNRWGSNTCSFQLRRNPGAIHPDLSAFTPCDVEIAGMLCWSGRVRETPARDGTDATVAVQGHGWQYHLDDDPVDRFYVHTRLADWRDQRSFPTANLAQYRTGSSVQVVDGAIVLSHPANSSIITSERVGVTLDLGPGKAAKRIVVEYEISSNLVGNANFAFIIAAGDVEDEWTGSTTLLNNTPPGASVGPHTVATTAGTAKRYVHLFLHYGNVPSGIGANDVWVRIKSVKVFADTAYESGNASILTADQIVNDALENGTLLLSTDGSLVEAGTFPIDDFPPGARSTRELIAAANAYENYETKIDVDRRPIFRARASAPIWEIGEWSGADFDDAGQSGDEIYSKALLQGTGPDGGPLSAVAHLGAPWQASETGTFPNPGFEVDASGWTVLNGSLARDTGVALTGAASGQLTDALGASLVHTLVTGLVPGRSYRLALGMRRLKSIGFGRIWVSLAGPYELFGRQVVTDLTDAVLPLNTWTELGVEFVAEVSSHAFAIRGVLPVVNSPWVNIDDLRVETSAASLVNRRRFQRTKILPVQSAVTDAAGERLSSLWLDAHEKTPFKGSFRAVGQGGVRRVIGGQTPHPGWLLRDTGQLVRCSHRVDPDTGAWGRDGEIDSVQYSHDDLTATVSLDENRAGFETLLNRLAVVVGGR